MASHCSVPRTPHWKLGTDTSKLAPILELTHHCGSPVYFDKAYTQFRATADSAHDPWAAVRPQTAASMACRQRLCCSLLRTASTSPCPIVRPIRATLTWKSTNSLPQTSPFSHTAFRYAETIIKVPEMAESISEGTLSSFSKQPGDHVERDEEIASIETDKVRNPTKLFTANTLITPFQD